MSLLLSNRPKESFPIVASNLITIRVVLTPDYKLRDGCYSSKLDETKPLSCFNTIKSVNGVMKGMVNYQDSFKWQR